MVSNFYRRNFNKLNKKDSLIFFGCLVIIEKYYSDFVKILRILKRYSQSFNSSGPKKDCLIKNLYKRLNFELEHFIFELFNLE